ncbi:MAG: amidase [Spirochaetaceae bacterium]|nr:MAG: amidase [Spirochaetaceae bacterium]
MTLHAPVGIGSFRLESDLNDSAAETRARLRARIDAVMDRIESADPHVHALLPEPGRRERVAAELDALFVDFPDPADRPPLFGVPVGVKDIFRVDGWETRAGSQLPPTLFAGDESVAVGRLKSAGAIVVGKTVTTEFAYFQPGPTRNPWNTAHTPGGSSSGSAAAVSAGFCPIALGTQTIGSIGRPASFCGVVGFKPSYGRVPTAGVIPFSTSADHVGVLAADVESATTAASLLCDDWAAAGGPRGSGARADGEAGRVAVVVDDAYSAQADDQIRAAVDAAVSLLSRAGWRVERVALFDDIATINEAHNRMVARDFADVHSSWVHAYETLYSARSLELIATGGTVTDAELDRARRGRHDVRDRVDEALARHNAAFIVSPSAPGAAPAGIDATGSPLLNLPWTYSGVPTVTLPAALSPAALPLGIQLAGRFGDDEALIAIAAQVEQALGFRPPR